MKFENIGSTEKLPDKVARTISESILSGDWEAGESMPTEPELASQFGVSRSVIRDAVRLLIARGLVIVHHGRGMFVSESQEEAFSEAFLLALRRQRATAWDTEEFIALILPEAFALAAHNAEDSERQDITAAAETYIDRIAAAFHESDRAKNSRLLRKSFRDFMLLVIKASHNKAFETLGPVLLDLKSPRYIKAASSDKKEEKHVDKESLLESISGEMRSLATAVTTGDSLIARSTFKKVFGQYKAMEPVLKNTPLTRNFGKTLDKVST